MEMRLGLADTLSKAGKAGVYRSARHALWKLSLIGLDRGPRITRYALYERLKAVRLPFHEGRVLAISKSANLVELLKLEASEFVESRYPDTSMLALPFEDASFDFVLSDQVLEHIGGNPQTAVDECHRVLRPGGIACHTTCFINPVHGWPGDFWRFTPEGLRVLHERWSSIIECDGWGNFDVWGVVRDGLRFEPVPHARWHPLHKIAVRNDPLWPIDTWIVAQK